MKRSPDKSYGCEYVHDGRAFSFCILAESREEAEARLSSMAQARMVGELSVDAQNAQQSDL
jgi:hypothetical protein